MSADFGAVVFSSLDGPQSLVQLVTLSASCLGQVTKGVSLCVPVCMSVFGA